MRNSLIIVVLSCVACTKHKQSVSNILQQGRWIDLTYSYSEETIYWPSVTQTFHLDTIFNGKSAGGFFYSAYAYSAPEHGGTHLDAPVHFAAGKKATDELTIDELSGEAIVIDVSEKALNNADYQIAVDDVQAWEKQNGAMPDNALLFFKTGYGKYYPDAGKYLGTTLKGDSGVAALHFPSIHPNLAQWLVDNRKIKAVGVDVASVDYGQSKDFKTHQVLYAQNIPGFENVANLDSLPAKGSFVMALPMKIKGGSGGPLRIAAWLPNAP